MVRLARLNPAAMPVARQEQCIGWMADTWLDPQLHLQACKGFKSNGITNALDGSEDRLMGREAKGFWDALAVAGKRDQAVHDVKVEVDEARLEWSYEDVCRLVIPFPSRGHLDATLELQDDEAEPETEEAAKAWSEGSSERSADSDQDANDIRGDGDVEEPLPVADAAAASGHNGDVPMMSQKQAEAAQALQARLDILRQASDLVADLNDPAINLMMSKIFLAEERRATGRLQEDPEIVAALEARKVDDDAKLQQQRRALQEELDKVADAKKAAAEAKNAQEHLKKVRSQLKEAQDIKATRETLRTFSVDMLGEGKLRGGGAMAKKNRMEVLQRLASHATLTPQDRNDWSWFIEEWDRAMLDVHTVHWGSHFAGLVQAVLQDLETGDKAALSKFMRAEIKRVLSQHGVLRV